MLPIFKNLKIQKYLIISILISFNVLLSTTFGIYETKWYAFLGILAIGSSVNSISALNLLFIKLFKKKQKINNISSNYYRSQKKSFAYIIPCYNENEDELRGTIDSLTHQITHQPDDPKCIIIVCDGKVIGKGNNKSTNRIWTEDILNQNINQQPIIISNAYTSWDQKEQNLDIYHGIYHQIPYILLVKNTNYGKRDSLVLVRRLLFNYNFQKTNSTFISSPLQSLFTSYLAKIFPDKIEYLIGTDADTVFAPNCTEELLKSIEKTPITVGCVGFVDISPECNPYSLYTLYQKAEYYYAQCLKRQHQSLITHKVNCLSGCVQILRICVDTCGDEILNKFNELPPHEANIFRQIRSYASEDRNHVCLLLSSYPKCETRQNLNAVAYTKIPMSKDVFLSQRRRWTLGATSNDIMLLFLPNVNFWEKLVALTNIIIFSSAPFIFVATIYFIRAIIKHPTLLMLFLSIIILFPLLYMFLIPLFIKPLRFYDTIRLYLSFSCYLLFGSLVNLIIWAYSIYHMDNLTWGKTRLVAGIQSNTSNSMDNSTSSSISNSVNNSVNNSNQLSSNFINYGNSIQNKKSVKKRKYSFSSDLDYILSDENLNNLVTEINQNNKINDMKNNQEDNASLTLSTLSLQDNKWSPENAGKMENIDELWDYHTLTLSSNSVIEDIEPNDDNFKVITIEPLNIKPDNINDNYIEVYPADTNIYDLPLPPPELLNITRYTNLDNQKDPDDLPSTYV